MGVRADGLEGGFRAEGSPEHGRRRRGGGGGEARSAAEHWWLGFGPAVDLGRGLGFQTGW